MQATSLQTIAKAMGGALLSGNPQHLVHSIATDTRHMEPNALFFALRGAHFDGHHFLDAASKKAACLVIDTLLDPSLLSLVPIIQVTDTLTALQQLASWYISHIEHCQVIAITGSNGKTSTKDITQSIFSQTNRTWATQGNLNNHIGLPLTLLSTPADCQTCIVEMGMSNPGEIDTLCAIAKPSIGIITHIGTAHIAQLKTQEAIALEKAALTRALPPDGLLILPANQPFNAYLTQNGKARVFLTGKEGSIWASNLVFKEKTTHFTLHIKGEKPVSVSCPFVGEHMVNNALLAVAAAWQAGLSIQAIIAGLSQVTLTSGRLSMRQIKGITVINDTYNANPDSMRAALKTLCQIPIQGRRIALLGDMAELGKITKKAHQDIGIFANKLPITLLSVGEDAQAITTHGGIHFSSQEEASAWLQKNLQPGDGLLCKASRSAQLEKVLLSLSFL